MGLITRYKSLVEGTFVQVLISHGKAPIVEHENPTKTLELEVYMPATVGKQVLGLGLFEPDF